MSVLCYTSGTTGSPKAVQISSSQLISNNFGLSESKVSFTSDDVALSFLPSAHIFDIESNSTYICNGSSIGFYNGDLQKLMEDFAILKPTSFVIVPKILTRLYDGI